MNINSLNSSTDDVGTRNYSIGHKPEQRNNVKTPRSTSSFATADNASTSSFRAAASKGGFLTGSDNVSSNQLLQHGNTGFGLLSSPNDIRPLTTHVIPKQEDSLFNYVDVIKNGTISPEQVGKFHNLALDHVVNYPDLMDYDLHTQIRVILSLFRKLNLVSEEIPFAPFCNLIKTFNVGKTGSFQKVTASLISERIMSQGQATYIRDAINILEFSQPMLSTLNEESVLLVQSKLDFLIKKAKLDISLDDRSRLNLGTSLEVMKSSVEFWTGYAIKVKERSGTGKITSGTSAQNVRHCPECLNNYLAAIISWDGIGAIVATAGLLALASPMGPVGEWVTLVATVVIFSWQAFADRCGSLCADNPLGSVACDDCPSGIHFFDGANCYYGWYPTPDSHYAYLYDYGFYYQPISPWPNCPDGNIGGPFLGGGHGMFDGINCIFGWWHPAYSPFIYGSGFYVKPKCRYI